MKQLLQKTKWYLSLLIIVAAQPAIGQVSHTIELYGSVFDPPSLSIHVGDTVHWFNLEGTHNINGSAWYEDNPEPFGTEIGEGWQYTKVFTIPGMYQYHCDVHLHEGMTGVIYVEEGTSSVGEMEAIHLIKQVYPVPADDFVIIELNEGVLSKYGQLQLRLFDHLGREQYSTWQVENRNRISVTDNRSGLYFYQLLHEGDVLHTGKVVVR